jgi:hypothetical protein
MPLPFALLVGLMLGMSLAWLARGELARSEVPLVLARPFLVAAGLGALVQAPVVAYFLALHEDWALLYLVRVSQVPSAVDLVLVLVAGAMVPLGFAVATPWATAKKGAALLRLGGILALFLVASGVLAARRLGASASYAQFHGNFGVLPIGRSALGRGVLLSWIALLAGFGWSARVLRTSRGDEA